MNKLKELYPYIGIVIVVVLIRSFLFTPAIVNGSSMEPTLNDKELVIVNKIGIKTSGLKRFDIVTAKYESDTLIKRVIGLPNETVEYIDNELYINGEKVISDLDFQYTHDFKLVTKDDEYILLGDNRNISKDSRVIGAFNIKNIKGKVGFVLFPFTKFGSVK